MGAVFPNGIRSFSTKVDYTQIIDANDINALQDEVSSIEEVLGSLLNTVDEIESDVTVLDTEQESDADSLARFRLNFATLRERLRWIQDGQQHMAVELTGGGGHWIPSSTYALATPTMLSFGQPASANDPRNMYNGAGITLRQGGFWDIQGWVLYDVDKSNGNNNIGTYAATLKVSGNWARGMDRQFYDTDDSLNLSLNPRYVGWLPQGTQIYLGALQSTPVRQLVQHATLSAVLIRKPVMDYDTTN